MTRPERPDLDAMTLKPSARLQRFLGRELIADPNLAILEFVKNAYDAGANHVVVNFQLSTFPTSVSIADDGIGMNEESFRFNWLRPGFSQKASSYRGDAPTVTASEEASKLAAARTPAGEKGLGRLSAGRLGNVLTVWTRPSGDEQWLKVEFDWSRFDDMYQSMDEVSIPFEYQSSAPDGAFGWGTLIEIKELSQSWVGRVPGRPAPGRPRTRLGRLRQDLAFLVRSQSDKERDFLVELDSDVVTETKDVGVIDPESSRLDTAQYVYRFQIQSASSATGSSQKIHVDRLVERSPEAVQTTGRPARETLDSDEVELEADRWPGPIAGFFLYTPPPAGRRAQDIDLAPTGVLLYRDDVLVEPYGLPGNDWLGVEARKASRQGHAAIQPSTFSGQIEIGRSENPGLMDMSNRLGLLDNDASAGFLRLVRREFSAFENLIYQEVLVEGNWLGKKEKRAARQAALAEEVAQLRLKALAHRAGQPLQAMGFDVVGLELLSDNVRIPTDIRDDIRSYARRLELNVSRLGSVVDALSSLPSLTASEFSIDDLIEQVATESAGFAEEHQVQIATMGSSERLALAPRDLAVEVVRELIVNAIEVPRASSSVGSVIIGVDSPRPDFVEVTVSDDGIGFGDQATQIANFEEIRSTKGRPAEGLVTAENAVLVMRGALGVRSTSECGTVMVFRVPTGASPVPAL